MSRVQRFAPNPQPAQPTAAEVRCDNFQRMLDPCNPLNFLLDDVREDWLALHHKLRCDYTA